MGIKREAGRAEAENRYPGSQPRTAALLPSNLDLYFRRSALSNRTAFAKRCVHGRLNNHRPTRAIPIPSLGRTLDETAQRR